MTNSERVILNSIVLYAKIVICIILSLWTVPVILHGLGASDYGLYSLVAGVVTMLTFLRTSMSSSAVRYLSVACGEGDIKKMNSVYNSIIMIHLLFGGIILIILEALAPFLFDHFLNIATDRIFAGKVIYQALIISMFLRIMTVPFDAELNAYENMIVFAIIEIIDSIIRLVLAFSIQYVPWDKLIWYGAGMTLIPIFNLFVKYIYTRYKYKELHISIKELRNPAFLWQIFSFTGWNTFGAMAGVVRNQGLAIMLNQFFSTIMNASYGIANQINAVMGYFSETLRKSIHPQLMQSAGKGDYKRMLRLVFTSSKFCSLVVGVITIPLIVELPLVLKLWLTDVPEYALEFTQLILISSLIGQMSTGLLAGVLAMGNIKLYQIVLSILMLLNLPIAYVFLKLGFSPPWILIGMIGCEVLSLIARLLFARKLCGLSVVQFCWQVILPLLVIMLIDLGTLVCMTHIMGTSLLRIIINSVLSVLIVGAISWLTLFNSTEKNAILKFVNRFKAR